MELTIQTMKASVELVSIRLIIACKLVHVLSEEKYTMKTNTNATVIARTGLTSSIHMTTHLGSFVQLSKHECPMQISDVRILHGWMTRIRPNKV